MPVFPDDEMVVHRDTERACDLHDRLRHLDIGARRRRILSGALNSFRVRAGRISRDGLRSRERLAAPVVEIRDVTFNRSRPRRSRPQEPVSGNHRQDHRRARGWSCAVGPAVGDRSGQSVAQHAEERGNASPLFGPQASKLIGIYDSQVSFGQSRVLLVWTRLIFPNGRSIVLERQQGADSEGYAELEDQVDYHWSRLFMAAALSTLLGVGSELGASNTDSDIVRALRRGSSELPQPDRSANRAPQSQRPADIDNPAGISDSRYRQPRPCTCTLSKLWRNPVSKLKIGTVLDDRPVKLAIELPAHVNRDLIAYAEVLGRETGQTIEPAKLIGPMLARFMSTDRAFARSRRTKRQTNQSDRAASLPPKLTP